MKNYLSYILGACAFIVLVVGTSVFFSWQNNRETAWIKSLQDNHPQGEEFVAELLKAREELNDKNVDNDLSAQLRMGVYLNLLEEKEKALEWYGKVLKTDATNTLALNNIANIYTDLGWYEKAETTWLTLIAAYPGETSFYRSLGYLYRFRLEKSPAEIEALFVRGLDATDNDGDLVGWLLAYFEETGNNEKWVEYANRRIQQQEK